MIKQYGTKATATIMVEEMEDIERSAFELIVDYCNKNYAEGTHPVIMPDVHHGVDCVIGFTAYVKNGIRPGLIGVDIGCGVKSIKIGNILGNTFEEIDKNIRKVVPLGFETFKASQTYPQFEAVCDIMGKGHDRMRKSIGTLGGGNHFIEIGLDSNKEYWLTVHTGSRNFGNLVAKHHMAAAEKQADGVLRDELQVNYLHDMMVAQEYASLNRSTILMNILEENNWIKSAGAMIESVHNYIDPKDMIIRKGALSARPGEKVIIPLNMGEGCIIGTGLGNPDWNYSFAHGVGRNKSRTASRKELSMDDFNSDMKHVWSSCVDKKHLDEAPRAYKDSDMIIKHDEKSVSMEQVIRPVYNLKG